MITFAAEAMQKYSEECMGCLKNNGLPHNLQDNRNSVGGFPESNQRMSSYTGAGSMEPDISFSSPSFVPPVEGYHRPMHQQDFCAWSAHPNIQKKQQNQRYALERCFYPIDHGCNFPINDPFESVHSRLSSQRHQPDFHFQEFQYFVVIDFEATCDKDTKPYPQEIIEFPSVLVNSTTGQLEDCFQIYVRPTYNQLLSDFCKELTGIQQNQVCVNLTI